jgi:NitT/TauT family transport system substrate-binding protein
MHFVRRTFLTAALLGIAAVTAAAMPGGAQSPVALKIATTPIDIGAQPFYAQDEGFFKNAGISADTQIISNGGAITAAVVGGSVDIAQSNIVSLATAHEKGLDLVLIAPAGAYSSKDATTALVVAKNSPIKTGKDLNGKTFAGNGLKNITQIGAFAWMSKNGGDTSTAKFVEMPFSNMPAALTAGRIDAAVMAEPDLSAALADGSVRVLANCYDAIANNFLIGAWFTTASWAKAHPDAVKRFQQAMIKTSEWANKNQAASGAILTKYTKITAAPNMKRSLYGTKIDGPSMQPLVDASAKYGVLTKTFPAGDMIAAEAR